MDHTVENKHFPGVFEATPLRAPVRPWGHAPRQANPVLTQARRGAQGRDTPPPYSATFYFATFTRLIYKARLQGSFTRLIDKAHLQGSFTRLIYKAHLQGSFTRLIYKAHLQGSFTRLIYKAHLQGSLTRLIESNDDDVL